MRCVGESEKPSPQSCLSFALLSLFEQYLSVSLCLVFHRRAFLQLSASPEAFLTLRSHFASTHACLSVCQYILGIGDRHLSNFMVDMETGGMIGIDFGHAFGSATQVFEVVLSCS